MTKPLLLTLWATPRSTSTAFEWMMRQRGDFDCFHEPWNELYYYGEDRRSRRDAHVPARSGHTYPSVWAELLERSRRSRVFVKDFVYSVEHDLDDQKISTITHTFLLRHPERVVQGLAKHWPDCTQEEVGFHSLHRLFHHIADRDGVPPPLLASEDLLDDPTGSCAAYCAAVGIDFMPEALEWEPGDRREVSWYGEGAGPWHDTLRASTGIQAPATEYPPLEDTPRLLELYQQCLPLYEDLIEYRLNPAPSKQE